MLALVIVLALALNLKHIHKHARAGELKGTNSKAPQDKQHDASNSTTRAQPCNGCSSTVHIHDCITYIMLAFLYLQDNCYACA